MKRISKRTREEAALICAIAASNQNSPFDGTYGAEAGLGLVHNSVPGALARDALMAARPGNHAAETYADAEALLRTGWTP